MVTCALVVVDARAAGDRPLLPRGVSYDRYLYIWPSYGRHTLYDRCTRQAIDTYSGEVAEANYAATLARVAPFRARAVIHRTTTLEAARDFADGR